MRAGDVDGAGAERMGTPAAGRSVAWHFERQALSGPDRRAIVRGDRAITYGELNRAADAVARVVRQRSHDEPRPIALLVDHGADVATAALGVLKAGAICAPLDPSDPSDRLRAQIVHAGPALIVAGARHAAHARAAAGPSAALVLLEEILTASRGADDPLSSSPRHHGDRPAWLYHTSGSTGRPKAVVVSHGMLLHGIAGNARRLELSGSDRFTWFGLVSAGQGVSNMLGAFFAGGTLYPHAPRVDGLAPIPDWLRRECITVYNSSATLFRAIVSLLSTGDRFPDVRVLRVGSEAVRREDFEAYTRHFPGSCVFVNRYSATEAGNIALNRLRHDAVIAGPNVPAGDPVPGKRVVILDECRVPVPAGVPGEIGVVSEHLALGYWRDEEATRAAFLEVPGDSRARLFLTGDLGRLLPDGAIEHLGRTDRRAKVRGQRVELDEIEGALLQHPSVAQAAVCLGEGRDGEHRIDAYLVGRPGAALTPLVLRRWLESQLPAAAVPGAFFTLETLPLTASGKVDRDACRSRGGAALRDETTTEAPRTALEREIARLWFEVLGVPVTTVHDDFLALGGDSLQGMRLLARVEDRWGVAVSFEGLLDAGTVAALAAVIRAERERPRVGRPVV